MEVKWIVFASILFLNSIAALVIAFLLWRKRNAPGCKAMTLMFIGLAIWTFCYAMITLSRTLDVKYIWLNLENIGIVSVPLLWFSFTLQYSKRNKRFESLAISILAIIPLVTLFLLFSGKWSNLYYTFALPFAEDGTGPLIIGRGKWYIFQLIENYALIVIGTGLLIWHIYQFQGNYQRQMYTVFGAIAIPWVVNTFYQLGARLFPSIYIPFDMTPIAFTITAALISLSVFGLDLFDLVPIARSNVMENISEMVLVVDAQNRILDANFAARKWLKKTSREIIGSNITYVFRAWPELKVHYENPNNIREEINVPDDPPSTFELIISPLYNSFGILEGRVIVAHDITERKQMENELKKANEAFKTKLAEVELLQTQLRDQAIHDPLTGVYNRRFLSEVLDGEVARAERSNLPISIAIIDVDFFKQFNDTYGHKCGDMVLQHLANLLMAQTRQSDVVCRYGGEEFVVLMPDATLDTARQRAESWRRAFAENPLDYDGQKLLVSFSVGLASFPLNGLGGEAILQIADEALYESKAKGRNLVTVYTPTQ